MVEAILVIGLLGLFAAYAQAGRRLARVEGEVAALRAVVERLRDGGMAAGPVAESLPGSHGVVARSPVSTALASTGVRLRTPEPRAPSTEPPLAAAPAEPAPQGPEPAPPPPAPARETLGSLFERFVGGRLLVWTGGIAIALAGLFLVRYSIELGLIGPRVRMIVAALFGLALLAAGEAARRRVPGDPRIGQALVGAGVLVLYATAYGSHVLYGLIGLGTAFALMAAVAAAALVLSLRHGTPAAALGLVGGFATPLLVGDPDAGALPLLGYLLLLNVAIFAVAVRTRRPWLGRAARWLTLAWTATLLFPISGDAQWVGLFVVLYTVATGLAPETGDEPWPWVVPTLALLELGVVVPIEDWSAAAWALYLALPAAGFAWGRRSRALDALPGRALPGALLLLAAQALGEPGAGGLPAGAAVTALFAGGAWVRLPQAPLRWTALFCAGVAGPVLVLRGLDPHGLPWLGWAAAFAALGTAAAALAWRMRGRARAAVDLPLVAAVATALTLWGAAASNLVPTTWLPIAWTLLALAAVEAGRRFADAGTVRVAAVAATIGALAGAAQVPGLRSTLAAAGAGVPALASGMPGPGRALLLFAGPGLVWAGLWRLLPADAELRRLAGAMAAVLGGVAAYLLFKQLFALREPADFTSRGFAERTLLTQALFFAGWLLAKRPRLLEVQRLAFVLTVVAAARFVWFDLLLLNPALVTQNVGAWPGLNLVLAAYGGSAFWLFEARRRAGEGPWGRPFLYMMLAALVAGAGLLVRQLFQGAVLTGADMSRGEFYGYSLAGLLLSVALLVWGWKRRDTPVRVAGLALLAATVVKVFLVDAAALEGLLRIASFLGLGVALIGMGKLYGTVLGRGGAPEN